MLTRRFWGDNINKLSRMSDKKNSEVQNVTLKSSKKIKKVVDKTKKRWYPLEVAENNKCKTKVFWKKKNEPW